jgi:hypothetical protein
MQLMLPDGEWKTAYPPRFQGESCPSTVAGWSTGVPGASVGVREVTGGGVLPWAGGAAVRVLPDVLGDGVVLGAVVGGRCVDVGVGAAGPVPDGTVIRTVGRPVTGRSGSELEPEAGGTGGISLVGESGDGTVVPGWSPVGDGVSAVPATVDAAGPACGLPATVWAQPAASSAAAPTASTITILRMVFPLSVRPAGPPDAGVASRRGAATQAGAGRSTG